MKINKKYIFGLCIFVALLFLATPIILFATGHSQDISSAVDLGKKNGPILYGLDEITETGNILEEYMISGWAFTPQTTDLTPTLDEARYLNTDKSILLFLASTKKESNKMYPILTFTLPRPDIFTVHHDQTSILGSNHGFAAKFSTIALPDDVYQLCIYTKESESLEAFSPVDIFFEKTGKSFKQISYVDEITMPNDLKITSNVKFGIDKISFDELQINGWTLMTDADMSVASSYLVLTFPNDEQHAYRINNINLRNDLCEVFNNNTFQFAGYQIALPEDVKNIDYFDMQTKIDFNGYFYLSEEKK